MRSKHPALDPAERSPSHRAARKAPFEQAKGLKPALIARRTIPASMAEPPETGHRPHRRHHPVMASSANSKARDPPPFRMADGTTPFIAPHNPLGHPSIEKYHPKKAPREAAHDDRGGSVHTRCPRPGDRLTKFSMDRFPPATGLQIRTQSPVSDTVSPSSISRPGMIDGYDRHRDGESAKHSPAKKTLLDSIRIDNPLIAFQVRIMTDPIIPPSHHS